MIGVSYVMELTAIKVSFQKFGPFDHFASLVSAVSEAFTTDIDQCKNVLTLHRSGLDGSADDTAYVYG